MKLIRRKEVEARTGLARSTIYLHIKHGKFPKPIKLGTHSSGWLEEEINQWMNNGLSLADQTRRIAMQNNSSKNTDEEELIKKLAALSSFEYDRIRKDEASKLGIAVKTLDGAVKSVRTKNSSSSENFDIFRNIEPWPEYVSGDHLLTLLVNTIKKFIAMNHHQAITVALWIVFTYCIDAFHVSPILNLNSPEKRCGKSTLLLLLQFLVKKPITASNITPAAIFRTIESYSITLLLDEVDTFMRNDNHELRGIINSGHSKTSAFVMRLVGTDHEPKMFSTWCAKCLAGIGNLPDTIRDRSIIISLMRKTEHETTEKLRLRDQQQFIDLQRKCARFAIDHTPKLALATPIIPVGLNDRASDNWEPLLAIAEAAGNNWAKISQMAATGLSGVAQESISLSVELLIAIKNIFDFKNIDKISTNNLLIALCESKELPWATHNNGVEISARQLAKLLEKYNIHSKDIRFSHDSRVKGYEKKSFEDAFARYVPSSQHLSATARQSIENRGSEDTASATEYDLSRIELDELPLNTPLSRCRG